MKVACTVWGGGKLRDYIKELPIVKNAYLENKLFSGMAYITVRLGMNEIRTGIQVENAFNLRGIKV